MKKILIFFIILFGIHSIGVEASSLFEDKSNILYCGNGTDGNSDCSLDKGTEVVKNGIDGINTRSSLTEYIQNVVKYILTFVSLIAVLYIIYAGFSILISGGNDEVQKKQKKTIFSIVIGILLIWLAYTIVNFIIDVANQGGTN